MINRKYNISKIIAGFFTKSNTKEEEELLKEWLNESDENLRIFSEMSDYERYEQWESLYSHFEKRSDWQDLKNKIGNKGKGRQILAWSVKAAAIIILPLIFFIFINKGNNTVFHSNTLIIPKGTEHYIVLSDGTKVWLNADTKFTYPASFCGEKREVTLEGEAFFEVSPDKHSPFIVKTGEMSVVVMGTEFNLRTYRNEGVFQITLNKGKVRVCSPYEEVILTPDQQASLTSDNKIIVNRDIDASIYSAWKTGMFRYKDQQLNIIAEDLERWYNVNISFDKLELASLKFSINVDRYNSIEDLLELIKETGKIDYEIIKDSILIKEIRQINN